jgi:ubiquinone/menaquinone biosynthesis C-methylase UbiE
MFKRDYEVFFAQEEKLRRLIFHWLPSDATNLIDLGCKTGNITVRYQDKIRDVIGLDKDYLSVLQAKRNFPQINFLVGKIEELPLKTGSFNSIVISEVLHHITEPQKAIEEIYRVLKPKGTLILSVPQNGFFNQYFNPINIKYMWRAKTITSQLRQINYSLSSLRELFEGKFVLEKYYRGGTILYPYWAKMMWYLAELPQQWYYPGTVPAKKWALRKKTYLFLLSFLYKIFSWLLKSIIKIDFLLPLGKYSYNLVIRARRSSL